ncbi:MAG: SDR family oxidoreductase, partial [Dehalococcoidia bacterium]|nr:SDR family oxidoreductase [Dehalococcoidia bacterium]
TSRTLSKLEPVAAQIKALGKKSLAVASDVTDERSVKAMVEQVVQTFSHVDILVNAAGINIRNSAEEISIDDWKKVMDFNALGTFVCCQAVGRVMIKQKSGKIVNVSSVRGRYGAPSGAIAYSPSKGAVDTLTRTLACEWAKYNIFVNAVAPTLIETDLTRQALANPEFAKTMKARIPLGRWGFPEDVVGPTVFLASKASDFVTGQIIYVDGGTTTW